MDKREAYRKISRNIEQVQKLIKECKELSDKSGESFYFRVEGSGTYGTGMTYNPDPSKLREKVTMEEWKKLSEEEKRQVDEELVGWSHSNKGC